MIGQGEFPVFEIFRDEIPIIGIYSLEMNTWFAGFLLEEMSLRGMSQKDLAGFLNKTPQKINRWLSGSMPKGYEFDEVVVSLGGNLNRARRGWKGRTEAPAPEVFDAGEVVGLEARIEWVPERSRMPSPLSVEGAVDPERWALGQGPALLLRLGERLGDWPAGSTLILRAWREGARPPAGLWSGAARADAWGPGASGWRLRRMIWAGERQALYTAHSLDPLRADALAIPADALELGAIACGVILPL